MLVNSGFQFVFVCHWLILNYHFIYKERNHSIRSGNIIELLLFVENSSLCEGLPDMDEVKSLVVGPTAQVESSFPGTILCQSIPEVLTKWPGMLWSFCVIQVCWLCNNQNKIQYPVTTLLALFVPAEYHQEGNQKKVQGFSWTCQK